MSINNKVVIVLHEIYGLNSHIDRVRSFWEMRGFDVYTPKLFPHNVPYDYSQQKAAYTNFVSNVGYSSEYVVALIQDIRPQYKTILVVGFSAGATIAWLTANTGLCDGAICYYGSRIRNYSDISPRCPTLVINARYEVGYNSAALHFELGRYKAVRSLIFDAQHGFCDSDSPTFDGKMEFRVRNQVLLFKDELLAGV